MTDQPTDPAEAIAAALARLRGRRPGRPPWVDGAPFEGGDHPGRGGAGHHDERRGHGHHGGGRGHHGERGQGNQGHGRRGPGGPGHGGGRFGGPARLRMLDALAGAADPLAITEIAEAVGVDQPRASRLVQQSVQLGLVRREVDQADARRTRVALTDEGRALVRGVRGERRAAVDSALASFTDDERAELARLLTRLAEAWPRD